MSGVEQPGPCSQLGGHIDDLLVSSGQTLRNAAAETGRAFHRPRRCGNRAAQAHNRDGVNRHDPGHTTPSPLRSAVAQCRCTVMLT